MDVYSDLGFYEYNHLRDKSGFVNFGIDENYSMDFTQLVLAKDVIEESEMCSFIYHEMMHAVGFPNHNTADQDPEGVLTDGLAEHEEFSNLDKMLIDTLYNAGIPIGAESDLVRQNTTDDR